MRVIENTNLTDDEVRQKHTEFSANKLSGLWYGHPGQDEPFVLNIEDAPPEMADDRRSSDPVNPFVRPETADRLDVLRKDCLVRGRLARNHKTGYGTQTAVRPTTTRTGGDPPEWDHLRFTFDPEEQESLSREDFEEIRRIFYETFRPALTPRDTGETDDDAPDGRRSVIVWPLHDDTGNWHIDVFIHRFAIVTGHGADPRHIGIDQVVRGGKKRWVWTGFTDAQGNEAKEPPLIDFAPLRATNAMPLSENRYAGPQYKELQRRLYEANLPLVQERLDEAPEEATGATPGRDHDKAPGAEVDQGIAAAGGRQPASNVTRPVDEQGRRLRRRFSPEVQRIEYARERTRTELQDVYQQIEELTNRREQLESAAADLDHAAEAYKQRDEALEAQRQAEQDRLAAVLFTAASSESARQAQQNLTAARKQAQDAQETADEEASLRQKAERYLGWFRDVARRMRDRYEQEKAARKKAENDAAAYQEEANQYLEETQNLKQAYDRTAAELEQTKQELQQVQKDRDRYRQDADQYAKETREVRAERDQYRAQASQLQQLRQAVSLDQALETLGDNVPDAVKKQIRSLQEQAGVVDRLKKAGSIKALRDILGQYGQKKIDEQVRKGADSLRFLEKISKREGGKDLFEGIEKDDPSKVAAYFRARGFDVRWDQAADDAKPDDDGSPTPSPGSGDDDKTS